MDKNPKSTLGAMGGTPAVSPTIIPQTQAAPSLPPNYEVMNLACPKCKNAVQAFQSDLTANCAACGTMLGNSLNSGNSTYIDLNKTCHLICGTCHKSVHYPPSTTTQL